MNLNEAYSILEIPSTATAEEAKKKYREFTKKYHPDINKEPDAEAKFKKINEAYQVISSGKSTDREDVMRRQTSRDPFNPFGRQVMYEAENINISTTISFKDSVLGCKKELKFNRKTKCQNCNGQGEIQLNNGCTKCGGRGQIVGRQGPMVTIQTCDKCFGRTQVDACKVCSSSGVLDAEASISVTVPGGIQDGNILRLGGIGHFVGSFGPMEQHTDVHLHVSVTPQNSLRIEGMHVVSELEISLLDALKGCQKTVPTILGDKEITIKPRSRHKEEVVIPNVGVNRIGSQRVVLDVKYPADINQLISTLSDRTT